MDFHAHFLEPDVFARGHPHSVSSCFGRNLLSIDNPVFRRMFEPELQIEDMVKRGIDIHLLSSANVIQSQTWAEPQEEAQLCSIVNDECMRWVERFPDYFIGSAVVPLGNEAMCLSEIERAQQMGVRVLNLPSNYRGIYLGEDYFAGFWEALAEKQMIAFIHPEGTTDMWFQNYAMWNSIGQSIEEVKVMSSLIYEGVLDRHKGIKIVMAHGGGYMPHYMGRLDRNVKDKPFTAKNIRKLPSEYLADFYYDSCVYDARTLELLIERVGIEHVVLGGDYPVGGYNPLEALEAANLQDRDRAAIAGGNMAALLGLG